MARSDALAAQWTVKLPVSVEKEGSVFVASIPALDIASQGTSREDALAMLEEAADMILEHCLKKGTWMKFLAAQGVTPTRAPTVAPPKRTPEFYREFPVWMLRDDEQTLSRFA